MSLKSIDFSSLRNESKGYFDVIDGKKDKDKSHHDVDVLKNDVSKVSSSMTTRTKNTTGTGTAAENVEYNNKSSAPIVCCYVGNIPLKYRSADLRAFFKQLIEKDAFDCFHFRHRPEKKEVKQDYVTDINTNPNGTDNIEKDKSTCCCLVKCKKEHFKLFCDKYHKKPWFNSDKAISNSHCIIKKMTLGSNPRQGYHSNKEILLDKHECDQEVYIEDTKTLIEFNPPENVMPQGNVGTPTKYFHEMISKCLLPCSVIKKLGLEFPKSKKHGKFSSVGLDYKKQDKIKITKANINANLGSSSSGEENDNSKEFEQECDNAEEWDRYEALHDDVDNQSRPKERLFEEDLEVKWEKGGSGLVFYTDAYFWNEMKGKDFDEDTVDDWDVDYSVYYQDGAGDKPSRDQLGMRIEKRRREGKHDGPTKYSEIKRKEERNRRKMTEHFAQFEKYSKGFGSRLLKQQGWKEGEGVGTSKHGISEPIEVEGQLPVKRTGFGYHGEKLNPFVTLKKPRVAENDVYISTKYDEKDGEHIDAMRFHGMELLKYRTPKVDFTKGTS